MTASPLTLKATAYHEAGHAAIAWIAGRPLRNVTIVPVEGVSGSCSWARRRGFHPEWDGSARLQRTCEIEIQALLAGHFAEVKYRKAQGMSTATSVSWEADRRHAETLASYMNGSPAQMEAYLHWLLITAQQQVELQWRAIRALAIQLSKLRAISGRDAYQLMLRASIGG
jgi:hypothetical protein